MYVVFYSPSLENNHSSRSILSVKLSQSYPFRVEEWRNPDKRAESIFRTRARTFASGIVWHWDSIAGEWSVSVSGVICALSVLYLCLCVSVFVVKVEMNERRNESPGLCNDMQNRFWWKWVWRSVLNYRCRHCLHCKYKSHSRTSMPRGRSCWISMEIEKKKQTWLWVCVCSVSWVCYDFDRHQ